MLPTQTSNDHELDFSSGPAELSSNGVGQLSPVPAQVSNDDEAEWPLALCYSRDTGPQKGSSAHTRCLQSQRIGLPHVCISGQLADVTHRRPCECLGSRSDSPCSPALILFMCAATFASVESCRAFTNSACSVSLNVSKDCRTGALSIAPHRVRQLCTGPCWPTAGSSRAALDAHLHHEASKVHLRHFWVITHSG